MKDIEQFLGRGNFEFAIGVVEDVTDPLALGRVKVRCFGYHPVDRAKVPTVDLPWATVLQSSASTSGVGFSPNYLKPDSWVFVMLLDGDTAQFPMVMGSIPRVHDASAPGSYVGNSGSGYHTDDSLYSGSATPANPNSVTGEFYPAPQINPSGGSVISDDGSHLTKQNISQWPLKIYKHTPARGDYGLACKDADSSLFIHYASALALEELAKRWGTPPKINSAYRTPAYNARLAGAAKNSQHTHGRAFDIPYNSIGGNSHGNLARFAQTAVQCGFVGFGLYPTFIHIDTGSGRVWGGASAAWFTDAIKQAGWYPGKPGLKDVRTTNATTANNSTSNTDPTTTGSTTNNNGNVTPQDRQAIKNIESSGGNYNALGNETRTGDRAYGAYQVMGANIPSWTQQYYGQQLTPSQFLANPAAQDAVFDGEFGRLKSKYGGAGAAQAWFAGEGGMKNSGSTDVNGMSVGKYGELYNQYTGTPSGNGNNGYRDPSGSLPYGGYQGKPSTHHTAVGFNGNMFQPEIMKNNDARLTTFPTAGDKGTVGEPQMSEAPQYPYNFVYASLTGHMWEMDDTPGVERVNLQHRSGSRLVMGAEGTTVLKSQGNMYNITSGDSYQLAMGAYKVSVKDDIDMRSTSDVTIHADGTVTMLVRNDAVEHTSGKKDVLVGETLQIKCNRLIIEAENIDFVAHSNITMEAGGDIKMRSGGNMATSSGGDTTVFSSGGFHADASDMKWLEGQAKEVPEMTGKSTDLGTPQKRSTVLKTPYQRKNPDIVATADDAMSNYGPNDPTKRTSV